jgi:hypothetical protein
MYRCVLVNDGENFVDSGLIHRMNIGFSLPLPEVVRHVGAAQPLGGSGVLMRQIPCLAGLVTLRQDM